MASFALLGAAATLPAVHARYIWYPNSQPQSHEDPHVVNLVGGETQSFGNKPTGDTSSKAPEKSTSAADPKTSNAPPKSSAAEPKSSSAPKATSSNSPAPNTSKAVASSTANPSSGIMSLTSSSISSASASATSSQAASSSGGISSGAVAGIVIAVLAIAGAVAAFVMIRRKNRRSARARRMQNDPFTMGFGSHNPPPASTQHTNNNMPFQSPPQAAHMSPYSNMTSAHTLSPPMSDATAYHQAYYAPQDMEKTEAYAMSPMDAQTYQPQQPMQQPQQQQQQQPQQQMYEPHLSPVAGNDPHNPMAMGAAAAVAGAGVGAMGADHANTTATEQPASNGGSLGVYAVIATYTPTLSDEIDIQHGDQIELIVEYDDGWCQGVNLTRGNAKGVFPRHCIAQYPGQQSSQPVSDHPPQVELSNLKRVSSMYMAYS